MATIAGFIHEALEGHDDVDAIERVRQKVGDFCSNFPLHKAVYEREAN